MKSFPKILNAETVNNLQMEILFSDYSKKIYDFNKISERPPFNRLKNKSYFNNFKISEGGYGIEWDEETDIAESELWLNGIDIN